MGALAAATLAGSVLWLRARPVPVPVIPVLRMDVTVTVSCDGTVRSSPGYDHLVHCPFGSARVRRLLVKPGDTVRQEQPLVVLDDGGKVEATQAEVRAARSALSAARALESSPKRVADRRAERQRLTRIRAGHRMRVEESIGKAWSAKRAAFEARDQARARGTAEDIRRADYGVRIATIHLSECLDERIRPVWSPPTVPPEITDAEKRLARAEKALRSVRLEYADPVIRSRVRGRVRSLRVKPGDAVLRGRILLQVEDHDSMRVHVAESDLRERVSARSGSSLMRGFGSDPLFRLLYPRYARARYGGMTAAIPGADAVVTPRGSPGSRITGSVEGRGRDAFDQPVVFVRLDHVPDAVHPGMPVHMEIVADRQKNVLTLPRTAILGTTEAASVLIVRGGRIVLQPVKIAGAPGLEVIIAEGLSEGDLVVKTPDTQTAGRRVRPVLS